MTAVSAPVRAFVAYNPDLGVDSTQTVPAPLTSGCAPSSPTSRTVGIFHLGLSWAAGSRGVCLFSNSRTVGMFNPGNSSDVADVMHASVPSVMISVDSVVPDRWDIPPRDSPRFRR